MEKFKIYINAPFVICEERIAEIKEETGKTVSTENVEDNQTAWIFLEDSMSDYCPISEFARRLYDIDEYSAYLGIPSEDEDNFLEVSNGKNIDFESLVFDESALMID